MNLRNLLVALAVILPFVAVQAEEETESWDVNAIPGEPRDITIDTRTGTWMSVDVSPDGQTIAFDLLADSMTPQR
jgi:hypothetical protein